MKPKHMVQGGVLGFIGFMLSPLSWWNDAFVNIPLAIGFGWIVGSFYKPLFQPAVVLGYWLTNVLGLVLMHKGAEKIVRGEAASRYSRKDLFRDVIISIVYTAVIVVLLKAGVLKPLQNYFRERDQRSGLQTSSYGLKP